MQIQVEIVGINIKKDDAAEFTLTVTDSDEAGNICFETVVDASLASFLVMRRDNRLPRDAFDKAIDAIESLNYSPMLAEELLSTTYESDPEA